MSAKINKGKADTANVSKATNLFHKQVNRFVAEFAKAKKGTVTLNIKITVTGKKTPPPTRRPMDFVPVRPPKGL